MPGRHGLTDSRRAAARRTPHPGGLRSRAVTAKVAPGRTA